MIERETIASRDKLREFAAGERDSSSLLFILAIITLILFIAGLFLTGCASVDSLFGYNTNYNTKKEWADHKLSDDLNK